MLKRFSEQYLNRMSGQCRKAVLGQIKSTVRGSSAPNVNKWKKGSFTTNNMSKQSYYIDVLLGFRDSGGLLYIHLRLTCIVAAHTSLLCPVTKAPQSKPS